MPTKKKYEFTFEPFTLYRVYWDEKEYKAIIEFDRSTLFTKLGYGEKDNFLQQLAAYCMKSKIGFEVHPYEEN